MVDQIMEELKRFLIEIGLETVVWLNIGPLALTAACLFRVRFTPRVTSLLMPVVPISRVLPLPDRSPR